MPSSAEPGNEPAGRDDGSPAQPEWLSSWRRASLSTAEALLRLDGLAAVDAGDMIGRWRGSGLHTGHPLDGLLERFGWYGKEVRCLEIVHPLLFRNSRGSIRPADPQRLPLGFALRNPEYAKSNPARMLFPAARIVLWTSSPTARLRTIEYRGVASAAIVYDKLPIIDHLRRVDEERVVGVMDLRSMPQPFFFLLSREEARASSIRWKPVPCDGPGS